MSDIPETTRWWAAFEERLAGTAVAVGISSPRHGRRHWFAGELSREPVTDSTTFYAASVTKQLIGALVARSVLDGDLGPQTLIASVLEGLPAWIGPVRVHHLLHHTAALPQPDRLAAALGYPDDETGWSRLDNEAVLVALRRLEGPPGPPSREFRYDNTGYILLAELLRTVRRRDVAELARIEVFDLLGLTASRLGGPAPVSLPGHPVPPATTGDGGLWTCLADLMTWLEGMNGARLGADLTALVQSPGRLDDGSLLDYAWGIGPRPGPAGTVYLHGGEWPGWCSMTVRCPTSGTAVAVLATADDISTISTAAQDLHARLASGNLSNASSSAVLGSVLG